MFHVSSVFIRYFLIGDVILVVDSPHLYRPVKDMAVNGEFFFFFLFFGGVFQSWDKTRVVAVNCHNSSHLLGWLTVFIILFISIKSKWVY